MTMGWKEDASEQNTRLAAKMLEQQGEINQLKQERADLKTAVAYLEGALAEAIDAAKRVLSNPKREFVVRAERTEPATGEDVEAVARILHNTARPSGTDWYATANDMDRGLAQVKARGILAALGLPGRERALREEIEELAGELAEERTLHDATNAERDELRARIDAALSEVSNSEGEHHKQFAMDQVLRALTGCPLVECTAKDYRGDPYTYMARGESEEYLEWIRRYRDGEDGPETYSWDEGIAP